MRTRQALAVFFYQISHTLQSHVNTMDGWMLFSCTRTHVNTRHRDAQRGTEAQNTTRAFLKGQGRKQSSADSGAVCILASSTAEAMAEARRGRGARPGCHGHGHGGCAAGTAGINGNAAAVQRSSHPSRAQAARRGTAVRHGTLAAMGGSASGRLPCCSPCSPVAPDEACVETRKPRGKVKRLSWRLAS